jgi:hypothetical protein
LFLVGVKYATKMARLDSSIFGGDSGGAMVHFLGSELANPRDGGLCITHMKF